MRVTPEQQAEIDALRATETATRRASAPALEEILYRPLPVLDHGFVRVVDYMGDDAAVVQAARVSYGRGTRRVSEDRGLINYLMRHRHTTPFEMCEIKYHVKLPIFVARQWIRHRTANVNEYSARYSILDNEFYIPEARHLGAQSRSNRQGRAEVLEHAGYFAELIDEWAPEGDPSDRLFRLGATVMAALAGGVPAGPAARYFEYWLLRLQGVYPSLAACHECGAALRDRGAQVTAPYGVCVCRDCGPPGGGTDLSPAALAFLSAAAKRPPEQLGEIDLPPRAARELAAVHRLLIAANLQKELRSLRVLRELHAGGI